MIGPITALVTGGASLATVLGVGAWYLSWPAWLSDYLYSLNFRAAAVATELDRRSSARNDSRATRAPGGDSHE